MAGLMFSLVYAVTRRSITPFIILIIFVVGLILFKDLRQILFFKSRRTLEDLRRLRPDEFEEYIANLFQKMGYTTEKVGGAYDGGIDVIAKKNGVTHYIQCKKFITRQVSVGDVRNFYGAIVDKLSGAKAFFITTNIFTLEAEKFVEDKPIELIDGRKLMEYVRMSGINILNPKRPVFGSDVSNKCPQCGSQLVLRTARKGPSVGKDFYGCSSYPRCKFIRNIS
jgi:restriction system protein